MKQRTDARRNRDALLDAAEQVFAHQGASAPLELVHLKAGLGRATLYRNFPDRQALLFALADRAMQRIESETNEFWSFLTTAAEFVAQSEAVQAIWEEATQDTPAIESGRKRLTDIADGHLRAAKRAGQVSENIQVSDIMLILRMIGGAARRQPPESRKSTAQRALALLHDGMTAGCRVPAPGGAGLVAM
ncbi:TetR/AcrR family transcriptional regulator [Yoonia maritima]|uniref:TetR/AcrR family transcriptional regulator n=1 Tax=Yoonia maritima TaxID=1435347 RepID=UPI000D10B53A|nr:helix-turn-helix domain-containing protein [Yoonia maritima]